MCAVRVTHIYIVMPVVNLLLRILSESIIQNLLQLLLLALLGRLLRVDLMQWV